MPQMAPMNWTMLFFYFIILFLLLNSINYFNFTKLPMLKMINFNKKMLSWKW